MMQLEKCGSCTVNILKEKSIKEVKWQGKIIDLVELIYALHEAKCFDKTSLKDLFAVVGETFGCEIKNYYRLFWDIKNRMKSERTIFLNELKKGLTDKLLRMDKED
jgi:hypothetical protein